MFYAREKLILKSLAEAIIPPGRFFDAGGESDVEKLENFLRENKRLSKIYRFAIKIFSILNYLRYPFKGFVNLSVETRVKIIKNWRDGGYLRRSVADLLCETLKVAHFSDEGVYTRAGCVWDKSAKNIVEPRYMKQVKNISDFSDDELLECDVVVVGTGAGGAVVAKELAERGVAVLIIEEGKYYDRRSFTGQTIDCIMKFYRDKGFTYTLGNVPIGLPMGRLVGGSTAINTATSWRTPVWILEKWVNELGLKELSPEKLAPYFERVEKTIQIERAKDKVVGPIADVIARGCNRLGYRHYPVKRNAPECDGQGVCALGCPTDAKLSTNTSYIPMALNSNALLLTETRAKRIILEGNRAAGIEAECVNTGKKIKVSAKIVVLACGAIMTPSLLLKQGICNSSGLLGRNLTIHPALNVIALCENDNISSYKYTPQGYCVDTFHREGILLLTGGLPIDVGAVAVPFVGKKLAEVMSNFDHLASFGLMVEDRPSGRILLRKNGKPLILYWLRKKEFGLIRRGIEILCEIFLSAGAKEVYPIVRGFDIISTWKDFYEFKKFNFSPRDIRLVAFHPLGTCRMGIGQKNSVVNQSHETHDIKNLFISDGSVVPTSIAVNPQETIMALSTRASFEILKKLE